MIAGNTGNVVCNTSFTNLSDSRVKTEMVEADVAELQQLFDAKQYKRPDMNEDLRLGFASNDFAGTKWKNLTGTARWSDGTEMVTLDYSHLKGFQARLDGGSLTGLGGRRSHKKHGRRPQANHQGVYEDPRTGFGSIAQTLQQAQVRNPSISRKGEGVSGRIPGPAANSFVPLQPMNQLQWTWPT